MTKKEDDTELTLDGVPLGFSNADLDRDMRKIARDLEADDPMKSIDVAQLATLTPVEDVNFPEIDLPEIDIPEVEIAKIDVHDIELPEIDLDDTELTLAELNHL